MMQNLGTMGNWSHFVAVALFTLGLIGFLVRRNALVALMSVELMLNAANLILVEVSMRTGSPEGLIFVVFVVTVAAAEVAIGLGILLNLYRLKGSVELDTFKNLRG